MSACAVRLNSSSSDQACANKFVPDVRASGAARAVRRGTSRRAGSGAAASRFSSTVSLPNSLVCWKVRITPALATCRRRRPADVDTVDQDLTAARLERACDQLQCGRLAGAVGTDQAGGLAGDQSNDTRRRPGRRRRRLEVAHDQRAADQLPAGGPLVRGTVAVPCTRSGAATVADAAAGRGRPCAARESLVCVRGRRPAVATRGRPGSARRSARPATTPRRWRCTLSAGSRHLEEHTEHQEGAEEGAEVVAKSADDDRDEEDERLAGAPCRRRPGADELDQQAAADRGDRTADDVELQALARTLVPSDSTASGFSRIARRRRPHGAPVTG